MEPQSTDFGMKKQQQPAVPPPPVSPQKAEEKKEKSAEQLAKEQTLKRIEEIQGRNPGFSLDSLLIRGFVEDVRSIGPIKVTFRSLSGKDTIKADQLAEEETNPRATIQTAVNLKILNYVCRSIQTLSFGQKTQAKLSVKEDMDERAKENKSILEGFDSTVLNSILSLYQEFHRDARSLLAPEIFQSFS